MALANGDAKQVVSRRTSAFLTLSERDQKKFLNDLPNHARNPLAAQALMVKEIATLYASLPKGTRELLLLHLCDLPVTVSKRQVHSNENVHNAHLQTGKQTVVTSDIPAAITLLSKHIRSMGPSEESLLIRAATKAQMLPELNEIYRRFTPEGRNELIKALAENPTFSPVHEEINAPFYL